MKTETTTIHEEKDIKDKIKKSWVFLLSEIIAIISIPVFVILSVALKIDWIAWLWLIPVFFSFGLAFQYARIIHDWFYYSQNLMYIKDLNSLNNTLLILSGIILVIGPIVIPVIMIVLFIQLKRLKKVS